MSRLRLPQITVAAALAGSVLAFQLSAIAGQTNEDPEVFDAFAVSMGMYATPGAGPVVITVNRWTSEAERERLMSVLREKGQEALLDALRDIRAVGTIRTPNSIGYDLRLAYQEPGKDGGRRIIIATDRPIGFAEANVRPPSMDYPFTIIEMLMQNGKGEGSMSIAARIVPAGKTIIVENFDTQPVRLNRIESRKKPKQ